MAADNRPLSERLQAATMETVRSTAEPMRGIPPNSPRHSHEHRTLLREAAALARRVEKAQVGVLNEEWFLLNDQQELIDSRPMLGKRVALVEVE